MDSRELIESFSEFARQKNIDRPQMMRILEDVMRTMINKKYGRGLKEFDDSNFTITINVDEGDLEIIRYREVVDDNSEDIWDHDKISLTEARKIEPDYEEGEEVAEYIKLEDFGRRMVTTARQTLIQKIKDLEKDNLYQTYKDLVGEIITAEVVQYSGRQVILRDTEGKELFLPREEQIPKDRYRMGDIVRSVVERVDTKTNTPKVILSRTSPAFLERLIEAEVPEVYDGLITIKKIVREPGERAKVAVESYDDRIDPVGACVGMKGSRIHSIVRELRNENIDIINYTANLELFISRALAPAKITSLTIDEENKRVSVYLKPEQVSLAIGRGGHNIKLAGRLVDMEIDVFRELDGEEEEFDIPIEEFDDEIEEWKIQELKKIGLDTAKMVLDISKEVILRRTELEEEMIDEIKEILNQEFEAE